MQYKLNICTNIRHYPTFRLLTNRYRYLKISCFCIYGQLIVDDELAFFYRTKCVYGGTILALKIYAIAAN